ncbi:unnamed protein product [Rhodiola kirilowii]
MQGLVAHKDGLQLQSFILLPGT